MSVSLQQDVGGLKLSNPLILASGFLGVSGQTLARVAKAGAGAVVTKSSAVMAREGYPNPTIVEIPVGMLNAVGLPNPGIKEMAEEIMAAKKMGATVIGSVFGYTKDDFAEAAAVAEDAGADAVELNVSCPHVKGIGKEIGQDAMVLSSVTSYAKSTVAIPVIVKLNPNVSDIVAMARAAAESGADALTAINTVRGMAIDIDLQRPLLAVGIGGLSGPAIKPIALRCVYEIREELDIPIIGSGGILDWRDAVEFFLAGASAVQLGTALLYKDLKIFQEINKGLSKYLKSRGYRSLSEIVGLTHKATVRAE